MKSILFRCLIDGEMNYVDISKLYGGNSLQVMINKFFITSISFLNNEWIMHCDSSSWLTSDELTIFIEHFEAEVVYEEEI